MIRVEEAGIVGRLIDFAWPWVESGQQVFPLAAFSPEGLRAVWQRCVDVRGDHLLLARSEDASVVGVTGLLVDEECRFLGGPIGAPYAAVADAFLAWFTAHYADRPLSAGISARHSGGYEWWRRHGRLREASHVMVSQSGVAAPRPANACIVTPTAGSTAARLHAEALPDGWWTADRVCADVARWICLTNATATAYLAARLGQDLMGRPEAEVFAALGDPSDLTELLVEARALSTRQHARRLVFFAAAEHREAALGAGLQEVAGYADWVIDPDGQTAT